jgi:hypothetical protein
MRGMEIPVPDEHSQVLSQQNTVELTVVSSSGRGASEEVREMGSAIDEVREASAMPFTTLVVV